MSRLNLMLIDHYKNPRNRGKVPDPDLSHEVINRKCGDRLMFTARRDEAYITKILFEGSGCFYCLASASIACDTMSGLQEAQVRQVAADTRKWLHSEEVSRAGSEKAGQDQSEGVSKSQELSILRDYPLIAALGEIKQFPMRIGCADLAWKGLLEMLDSADMNTGKNR